MKCPACKNDMVVLEYAGVELDHCMECRGSWFDAYELETLVEKSGSGDKLLIPAVPVSRAKTGEVARRCPRCSRKMEKVKVEGNETLILDRCKIHRGYWFDGGEVQQFLSRELKNENWNKVNDFIKDILGDSIKREEK